MTANAARAEAHWHSDASARQKIRPIAEIAALAEQAQRSGKVVVLCHGVFDLVHLGHVRHLEAARSEGDMLIVTVTADRYVNKGPGRPIFSDEMRAEMLAALSFVDHVGINDAASAEPVLMTIKPNVYVKGSDYEKAEDDITGKIKAERDTVEQHGGRVVFTKDITFSSSSLINQHFDVFDPPLREYLDLLRGRGAAAQILELVDSVQDMRVVLVGDAIIDEYQYVTPLGKPSKEHLIATQYQDAELFAGGVFAAANHVADFCREVEVITTLGADDSREDHIRSSLKPNVRLHAVPLDGRPTTRKVRFVESGYMRKLFEVYHMDDSPLDNARQQDVVELIESRVGDADVVIVTDFGHGLIDRHSVQALVASAPFLAVNAQINSGNHGYNLITKYPRADFVCIDAPEARLAVGDRFSDIAVVASELLPERIDCGKFIITHGAYGSISYDRDGGLDRVPAFTRSVVDTVGAGDAFFSVAAPLVAAGGPLEHAAFVGNAAGAMKVGIVGHRQSVPKVPLMKYVTTLLK